jgi:hypothetical protein
MLTENIEGSRFRLGMVGGGIGSVRVAPDWMTISNWLPERPRMPIVPASRGRQLRLAADHINSAYAEMARRERAPIGWHCRS